MKRGGVLVVLVGLIIAFFYFGGEAQGPNVGEPEIPTVDETTGGIREFFTNIANAVSGWNEGTWRIIAIFVIAGICWWIWNKVPVYVWLVVAILAAIVAVQL